MDRKKKFIKKNALNKTPNNFFNMLPEEFRRLVKKGLDICTDGICEGYAHANLIIVPKDYAFDLLLFCSLNYLNFSVLEITEPGNPYTKFAASKADIRTDLPGYRIYKKGILTNEVTDISKYWRKNFVGFLINCTKSFEWILRKCGISWIRYGLYVTNIPCVSNIKFYGKVIVTVREFYTAGDAFKATKITSRHQLMQGPPIHIGDPLKIGVKNLVKQKKITAFTEKNDNKKLDSKKTMVSWSSGATLKNVVLKSEIPIVITNSPSHMLVTDKLLEELAVL